MIAGQLKKLAVPIDGLHPDPSNARKHGEKNLEAIKASLSAFGQRKPIVVQREGMIVRAGNGTLAAAKALGWTEIAAVVIDDDNATAVQFAIADNRTGELAEWDDEVLASLLDGMDDQARELLAFDDADVRELMKGLEPEEIVEDEAPEPPDDPVTKPGDLIVLGRHRLLCGDSRNADDVANLMDGHPIHVAFTSPPYASQRKYDESSGFRPIPPDDYVEWFDAVQANVAAHLAEDGSWFVNIKPCAEGLDTSLYVFDMVTSHVRKWGWHFATEFCWERSGVPKSVTQRFKNQFEPIYQFARGRWKMRPEAVRHASDSVPVAIGKGAGDTGWGDARQGVGGNAVLPNDHQPGMAYPGNRLPKFRSESLGHTAAFPVGLPTFFIKAYSDDTDAVYDPFLGSGTTLIAAEQLGRRCFGVEISPAYCDVIVARWEALTGEKAVRP